MSGASPPSNGIGWVMGSSPDANGGGFHYGSKGRSDRASSLGRPKGASPSAGGGGPLVRGWPPTIAANAQSLQQVCSQGLHVHWRVGVPPDAAAGYQQMPTR
jgi:hypothetical protein